MMTKILFIINPISGVGRKDILPDLIEKHLDHSIYTPTIVHTEYRKHAKEIAKEYADKGWDVICAVGGDGSVHEVGTALIGTQTKLAIIPTGSGNGLARHLHIPMQIDKAIELLNKQESILMDTVLVNDKPFLNAAGYGIDAFIAKKFNDSPRRGLINYVRLSLKEFVHYEPVRISMQINGITRSLKVFMLSIANASEFGNGFCISPESDVTDGKIELVLVKPIKFWDVPKLTYQFFNRKSNNSEFLEVIPFEKATINIDHELAQYDGEPFQVRKELNVEVVPKSLHILVGKK